MATKAEIKQNIRDDLNSIPGWDLTSPYQRITPLIDSIVDEMYDSVDAKENIISFYNPTIGLPVDPELFDRYVTSASGNGWTDKYLYEWDGLQWIETIPQEGFLVWVESLDQFYVFDGTNWINLLATSGFEPEITPGTVYQVFFGDKVFRDLNTSVVPEGTNLYYTNARVAAYGDTRYSQLGHNHNELYALLGHTHDYSSIYAPFNHNHTGVYAGVIHSHVSSDITDFATATKAVGDALYSPLGHTHDNRYYTETESDARYSQLGHLHDERYSQLGHTHDYSSIYAPLNHDHTGVYAGVIHSHVSSDITDFATATKAVGDALYSPLGHTHDNRYYTETESDARYSQLGHQHDDRYYTEAESDNRYSFNYHTHTGVYEPVISGGPSSQHFYNGAKQWARVAWDDIDNKPIEFKPASHDLLSLHTVAYQTPGYFLKVTGTGDTFGFEPHGLTYTDVGAAAVGHDHDSTYASITNTFGYVSQNFIPRYTGFGSYVDSYLYESNQQVCSLANINLGGQTDPAFDQGDTWITWGHRTADSLPYYAIRSNYKEYGSYTYSRLQINWHTGIEIGAAKTYGGTRFFNDAPFTGTQIMSIGDGDDHVRISNALYVTGSIQSSYGCYAYNNVTTGTYIGVFKHQGALPGYPNDYYPVLKTDAYYIYMSTKGRYTAYIGGSSNTNGLGIFDESNTQNVYLTTNGNSYLLGGNLGLGTTSPSWKLHVEGSVGANGDVFSLGGSGVYAHNGSGQGNYIGFFKHSGSLGNEYNGYYYPTIKTDYAVMYFAPNSKFSFYMVCDNSNVKYFGISSTNGATSTPDYIDLGLSYSNGATSDKCKIYLWNNGVTRYGFGVGSNGDIQYHSNAYHDFYIDNTRYFRVSSSGLIFGAGTGYSLWHAGNLTGNQTGHYHEVLHSTSHSGTYYVYNEWVPVDYGTYRWRIKSNHSDNCSVAHSDLSGNSNKLSGLDWYQFFNNTGSNHTTNQNFDTLPNFGFHYVVNAPNAPGTPSQYYGLNIGLGNDYAYTQYASQLYWARANEISNGNYIYLRDREGSVWGSWRKANAGYSDNSGAVGGVSLGSLTTNRILKYYGTQIINSSLLDNDDTTTIRGMSITNPASFQVRMAITGNSPQMQLYSGDNYLAIKSTETEVGGNFNMIAGTNCSLRSASIDFGPQILIYGATGCNPALTTINVDNYTGKYFRIVQGTGMFAFVTNRPSMEIYVKNSTGNGITFCAASNRQDAYLVPIGVNVGVIAKCNQTDAVNSNWDFFTAENSGI